MPKVAYVADLVFDGQRVRAGAALVVSEGSIVEIATTPDDAEVVHLRDRALVPGTINAHAHGFHSLLRGFGDDLTFADWRDKSLYRFAPRLRRDGLYAGALFAFSEMLLYGVTTVCDFFYLNDDSNENSRAVIRAAKDVGIRIVLARCFYDWDGAPAAFREDPREASARFLELRGCYEEGDTASVIPAPHSLHGASEAMIRAAAEAAQEADCPFHIQTAEHQFHVEDAFRIFGKTPVRALEQLGVLSDRSVIVHGCWLDDRERALIAERGVKVVHCPSANLFLGAGSPDITNLADGGTAIALGTAGGSTNSRVSIFDEMRACALQQKANYKDASALDALTAFHFGTAGGGEVLGQKVGQLAPGYRADFVTLDLADPSLWPQQSLPQNVVYAMSHRAICDVFVEGRQLVRNRELLSFDLNDIRERVRATTKDWSRRHDTTRPRPSHLPGGTVRRPSKAPGQSSKAPGRFSTAPSRDSKTPGGD